MYGYLEGAISNAVREGSLDHRRALLKEWRGWNGSDGAVDNIRQNLSGAFSVAVLFKQPSDARDLMNPIYDGLLGDVNPVTNKV